MRRKTGVQGEEIVQDLLNFSDWECNRVGQKWLGFPSGLGVREYWALVYGNVGADIFEFISKTAFWECILSIFGDALSNNNIDREGRHDVYLFLFEKKNLFIGPISANLSRWSTYSIRFKL